MVRYVPAGHLNKSLRCHQSCGTGTEKSMTGTNKIDPSTPAKTLNSPPQGAVDKPPQFFHHYMPNIYPVRTRTTVSQNTENAYDGHLDISPLRIGLFLDKQDNNHPSNCHLNDEETDIDLSNNTEVSKLMMRIGG